MRKTDHIKEVQDYFQSRSETEIQFREEAIAAAYEKSTDQQSLAIKILSIIGGIMASQAFLGFLFLTGLYDSNEGMLVFGFLLISGAIWINKQYDRIIIDTMSVFFYIIGFVLVGFGLMGMDFDENAVIAIIMLLAFIPLGIIQNYILSFVSFVTVFGGFITLIIANDLYDLMHLYVSVLAVGLTCLYLNEANLLTRFRKYMALYHPLRIALVFSFIAGLLVLGIKDWLPLAADFIWISSIVIIGAILYVLSVLFTLFQSSSKKYRMGIYVGCLILLAPTVISPAISGSILILLLSFLVHHKTGFVVGVIAFLFFISRYYYDLHFTLLTKSILLMVSGVLFIGLYLYTHKKLKSDEKV
jgi:Domain of unknown function (DUF4401)